MVVSNGVTFPKLEGAAVDAALEAAYRVEGREFHVFNVVANEESQTVFIELVEVEPRKDGKAGVESLGEKPQTVRTARSGHSG